MGVFTRSDVLPSTEDARRPASEFCHPPSQAKFEVGEKTLVVINCLAPFPVHMVPRAGRGAKQVSE